MQLTKEVVYGFTGAVLSSRFDNPSPTPDFHLKMWDMCCGDSKYVAIAAPRGHAKSSAITHAYVLASVLFRSSSFVVIISDTEGQAVNFLHDIKVELTENKQLIEMFTVHKLVKETTTELVVCMGEDNHTFKIVVRGSEQRMRGLKWRGKRPDLVVGDDLESDEIVMNKERREKFRKWFLAAVMPILSDTGKIRIVGTVLHADSFLERLMTDPSWKSAKFRAHRAYNDFSELLWPGKHSKATLSAIRASYEAQGEAELYSQEYLNQPLAENRAVFKKPDFLPMDDNDKESLGTYYITGDLAVSTKQRSDFTVFIVFKLDSKGTLNVVDLVQDRTDSLESVNTALGLVGYYKPQALIMDKGLLEKSIGPFLRAEMFKRNIITSVVTINPSSDKVTRARSIAARMRMGGVKFNKEREWYSDLEAEMLGFPRVAHDDQVDCMSLMGLHLDKLSELSDYELQDIEERLEDEELTVAYDDDYLYEDDGRSRMCGY